MRTKLIVEGCVTVFLDKKIWEVVELTERLKKFYARKLNVVNVSFFIAT
jgi:hypothetical protein